MEKAWKFYGNLGLSVSETGIYDIPPSLVISIRKLMINQLILGYFRYG